jgi:23S rRNA pseudouridine1911/1915/1917 synthase
VSIVYQDADVAVIDKAPGMVVHPGAGNWDGTLVNALLFHLGGLSGCNGELRPGIVHRLDRGTSGLLVVAKHDVAHARLAAQFAEHSAGRTYLALCMGEPRESSGTIRSKLDRHPGDRLRFASRTDGRGKAAITHWEAVGYGRGMCLIQCRLETGRTHQIRVHLTEAGWPLAGDPLYKRGERPDPPWLKGHLPGQRPMLHAWKLRFAHPADGRPMAFEAPPPADFANAVDVCEIPRIWEPEQES